MRKIKNLVIGGIQSKIFNLILFTVLLLLATGVLVSMHQNNMLGQLAQESGDSQNKAIEEVTGSVMDQVVTRNLERSNRSEARIAEKMFRSAGDGQPKNLSPDSFMKSTSVLLKKRACSSAKRSSSPQKDGGTCCHMHTGTWSVSFP